MRELFNSHLTDGLSRFVVNWPEAATGVPTEFPAIPPVTRWCADLTRLASDATTELVHSFLATAETLHWRQTYVASDFGAEFLDRYGYVELVGRRSRLRTDRMAAGLLMFGPDTHYPAHRHPAEEIYLPIAGTADYLMTDGAWQSAEPGTVIHNAPMVWHGTRTGDQPVLIAWAWLGGNPTVKSDIRQ